MKFLDKILALFGFELVKRSSIAELKEKIIKLSMFQLTKNSKKLLESLENHKIKALEKAVSLLTVAICDMNNKISEEREFLVDIASLQEQLLHELDQGKVIIVKGANDKFDINSVFSDDEQEIDSTSSTEDPEKKYDLN